MMSDGVRKATYAFGATTVAILTAKGPNAVSERYYGISEFIIGGSRARETCPGEFILLTPPLPQHNNCMEQSWTICLP